MCQPKSFAYINSFTLHNIRIFSLILRTGNRIKKRLRNLLGIT